MLSLTIKHGESVRVGEATVIAYRQNGQIRLVFDAPREVPIVRTELEERDALKGS